MSQIPATMHAVGFQQYGAADVLEPLERALPIPAADEVCIRVAAAGVNPADCRLRNGQFRLFLWGKLPFVPGTDVAGEVVQVGQDVTDVQVGDYVYAMVPTLQGGGYADYLTTSAAHVAPAPANLPLQQAAVVPLAALTALQALRDEATLHDGMRVLINGASGGVGHFAVQIARQLGAAHITGVCSGRNRAFVQSLGADAVIDYTQTDVLALPDRYDVIFDAVNAHAYGDWHPLLTNDGVFVSVVPFADNLLRRWYIRLRGTPRLRSVVVAPSRDDLLTLQAWIEAGHIVPHIDAAYALAAAADAHRYSESSRVRGKLALIVDDTLAQRTPAAQPATVRV